MKMMVLSQPIQRLLKSIFTSIRFVLPVVLVYTQQSFSCNASSSTSFSSSSTTSSFSHQNITNGSSRPTDRLRSHDHYDSRPRQRLQHAYLKQEKIQFTKTRRRRRNVQEEEEEEEIDLEYVKDYEILTSKEITEKMKLLSKSNPNLVTLQNAQEAFGLPAVGSSKDCPFDQEVIKRWGGKSSLGGCLHWFLTIYDHISHPPNSDSYAALPEVFLSGALHGDERIGPTAVIELAELLIDAAACEAMPGSQPINIDESLSDEEITGIQLDWISRERDALSCRDELKRTRGLDDVNRRWLARLVSTRRVVVVPTTNALGYFRTEREEEGIDINRDFPYDVKIAAHCMESIAARAVNEIFRQHMFQLSLTFHAGTEVIAYEWGAPTYEYDISPDDFAQKTIAKGYSRFAGHFGKTPSYPTGTMNEMVYSVRGGMEDWAYAGSWDTDRVIKCIPKVNGDYPPEKTEYNDSMLRAFNMLVETSNAKIPKKSLGTSEDVLQPDNSIGNGHIARNMRLALMAIDIVQPYVSFVGVNGVALTRDVVPLTLTFPFENEKMELKEHCIRNKAMYIPAELKEITVEWTVGGGFFVDFTNIQHANWENVQALDVGCDGTQPSEDDGDDDVLLNGGFIDEFAYVMGLTRWHAEGPDPNPDDSEVAVISHADTPRGPVFSTTINIGSTYNPGDRLVLLAKVQLDQEWYNNVSDDAKPANIGPMSHIVNARTNKAWKHESAGKIIEGRRNWYSIPLTLVIGSEDDENDEVTELFNPLFGAQVEEEEKEESLFKTKEDFDPELEEGGNPSIMILWLLVAGVAGFILFYFIRRRKSRTHERLESDEDEFNFDSDKEHDLNLEITTIS